MTNDTVGITFHESMSGPFALGTDEPLEGATRGTSEHSTLTLRATIVVNDVRALSADPNHEGSISGEVEFSPWGAAMPAATGVFRLFSPADQPKTKYMVYELAFEHEDKKYYLAGKKEVRDDPGLDLWADTTTLYTRLHDGANSNAPIIGAGVLKLGMTELMKMIGTMRALNAPSPVRAAEAVTSFGKFFAGELWETYARG